MISNLLMATGSQAPISTVDMVDPFGDGSGIALYKFDGDATDESGVYNGTATNVAYGTGKFGQCVRNLSPSGYVSFGIHHFNVPKTVSFWAKDNFILGNMQTNLGVPSFLFYGSVFEMYSSNASGTGTKILNLLTGLSISSNFNHYCITIDYPNVKIYYDGSLLVSGTMSSQTSLSTYDFGLWDVYANNSCNLGFVDQLRIFNRALTQEEVTALYKESVDSYTPYVAPPQPIGIIPEANLVAFYPLDTDARDDFSAYEGTASSVTFDGTKAVFNGSSSYINASTTAIPNGVFSISAWVQFASLANDQRFIAFNDSATDRYFRIAKPTTNKLIVSFGVLSPTTISSTTDCIINQWYHTVFIKDTATISLFVDGALIGSVASTGYADVTSAGSSLHFGCSRDVGYEHLNGSMSRVAIFNKALTQEEVTALYNEGQS